MDSGTSSPRHACPDEARLSKQTSNRPRSRGIRLPFRVFTLPAVRAVVPQVQNPYSRAAWFADKRVVSAPPLRQFKSEKVRDIGPVVTEEDVWPAILGNGVAGGQRVRPRTCLERRDALELGLRRAFLGFSSLRRQPAPLLKNGSGLRGVFDAEKLWFGHADRLRAAEPSTRRVGGADPEDFTAWALIIDHLVVGQVMEAFVQERLSNSVAQRLPNLVSGHGHRLPPQNIFDDLQCGHRWTLVRYQGRRRRHQEGVGQEQYINSLLNEFVTVSRRTGELTVEGSGTDECTPGPRSIKSHSPTRRDELMMRGPGFEPGNPCGKGS